MKQTSADSHFLGLRTVIYHAPDLDKAKAWYSSALGFAPYFDQPFYVGFNVGGYELGLDPDASTTPGGASGVAYWGVSEAEATFQRLLALGATEKRWGESGRKNLRTNGVCSLFSPQTHGTCHRNWRRVFSRQKS
jgi:catechol 2,3-dioxygenase-like lactoylglutathione lyase family enzyme